ncbi:MAG: phosphoribosyltransferase [Chromatiaceae bacterium]|nr:phosphoribosyltransferase [Chromatiaceae bacterium]MCF8016434.1 phosphoribosyltransferase [Chromatiaceae bacterium]
MSSSKEAAAEPTFEDRFDAGWRLADALSDYRDRRNRLVLGVPNGGVAVAAEVARRLRAPLDVVIAQKLHAPQEPVLTMGAIASGGVRVLNDRVLGALLLPNDEVDRVTEYERRRLQDREDFYRNHKSAMPVTGRCVLLIDDGAATGISLQVAASAVAAQRPMELVVALPVVSPEALRCIEELADRVIHLSTPRPFVAIEQSYLAFPRLTDKEVRHLLAETNAHTGAFWDEGRGGGAL